MSHLTAEDFEKIYQFYVELNHNYQNFENTTLHLLATLFGLRLTTYAIFDRDTHGDRYVKKILSNCIQSDVLQRYQEKFYTLDPFFKNISQFRYGNASRYVYTNQDFPPDVFENSDYGRMLASCHLAYQAILGGNATTKMPTHVLSVYKTKEDGPFTPYELELYDYIGRAFSDCMGLYKAHLRMQRQQMATVHYADSRAGYAILDSKQELISSNPRFLAMGSEISSCTSAAEIAKELVAHILMDTKTSDRTFVKKESIGELLLTVQRKQVPMGEEIENLTFLTLENDEKNQTSSDELMVFITQFDLTKREAEISSLIAAGASNAEICEKLYISSSTVKSHIRNIFGKLGVSTRTEFLRKVRALQ